MFRLCLAALIFAVSAACGFDADALPEPRSRIGPEIRGFDAGKEMPLERVSLMLAADSGNVQLIEILRDNATEIEWSTDGPIAMRFAARRGYVEVVALLASYGICGEAGAGCDKSLAEARANGHDAIVTLLEAIVVP